MKEKGGQTDLIVMGRRRKSADIHKRRKGDSTHFNITVGVESRNSVGGTADSLCRLFTKKTIKVC